MITDIKLPKLGVEMETARLDEWVVAEGGTVAVGDIIANVETEKVVFELPAPAAGLLHIAAETDEEYAIGDRLGAIAETQEEYASLLESAPAASPAQPAESAAAAPPTAQTAEIPAAAPATASSNGAPAVPAVASGGRDSVASERRGGQPLATPVARRLAAHHGIDLHSVTGSGRRGTIRRRDVEHRVTAGPPAVPAEVSPTTPGETPSTLVKLSSMRRTIAGRMLESMQGSAQMTDIREQDVTALVELRTRAAAQADALGYRLSYTTLLARAAIIALQRVPALNSSLESETHLRQFDSVNLGMAVALPDGLIVPVVHGAERLSVRELHESLTAVIDRARNRKASAHDLSGGTFTITNFGSFGSHMGTPILTPGQVGILGIGALLERPVVRDGQVVPGKVMHTCLTVDHRVVDGEAAGHFQNELGALIASPELLLLG